MGWTTNNPSDYFALGFQAAKDTEAVASAFLFFRHGDGTGLDSDEDVVSVREGGDGQEIGFRYKSLFKMDGAAVGLARSELAHAAAAAVMGDTATVINGPSDTPTLATGMQRHRYVPSPTLPWITGEQRFSDEIERATNLKGSTLEISGEAGKAAQVSLTLSSAGTSYQRDVASAMTPVRETADPVYFPRGTYIINGVGNAKITKFKATARVNLDDGIQTTELFREDLIELTRDFDLDFTLKYEDRTLYQAIKYGGGSQVPINLATGSFQAKMSNAQLSTATMYRALEVLMPALQFAGAKVNKLAPDGQTVYIDVSAMTMKSATYSLTVDVIGASRAAIV